MSVRKVIAAIRGPMPDAAPSAEGLIAYSAHQTHPDEPASQPGDVGGVVMAWFDADAILDPPRWFDVPIDAYVVDERVKIEWARAWPDGVPTPALELIPFVCRAPDLTRDEFAAHWSDIHGPLVPVHHPGVARYVQNVVIRPLTADAPELDGIAQLYFRTAHDLHERFFDSDEGRRVIADDGSLFLDRSRQWRMLAQETWFTPSPRA